MLSNYFYDLDIYRIGVEEDDWGNLSEDGATWVYEQTVQGMIQPKSGSRVGRNNDDLIVSDYLMYVELDTTVLNTDRIYFDDRFYEIVNMKDGTGVMRQQHHGEWDLKRVDDYEVL